MSGKVPREKCVARVSEPPHYLYSHRCSRYAVAVLDESSIFSVLCRQHQKRLEEGGQLRTYNTGVLFWPPLPTSVP